MNKKNIKIICSFVAVMLLVTGCSKEDTDKKEETNKDYFIGDTVTVEGIEYTVNSTEVTKIVTNNSTNITTSALDNFLVVNVTVKNSDSDTFNISDSYFKVINGDETFSASIEANTLGGGFFYNELSKGDAMTSNVYFDLNDDVMNSKELKLEVKSSGDGDKKQTILLNK